MPTFTLAQLVQQLNSRPECEEYPEQFVAKMIDGTGPLNRHLALPEGWRDLEPGGGGRRIPLSSETPVYGEFLVLQWHSHDPLLALHELESLSEVHAAILHGVDCYPWTEDQAAFVNGNIRQFVVTYLDQKGARKVFRKDDPELHDETGLYTAYFLNGLMLEWIA